MYVVSIVKNRRKQEEPTNDATESLQGVPDVRTKKTSRPESDNSFGKLCTKQR